MAQRNDDTDFLTRNSGVDNSWLVKKQDTNVGFSVLANYYAQQARKKAAQPKYVSPPRPKPQVNGMVQAKPTAQPQPVVYGGQTVNPQYAQNLANQYAATTNQAPAYRPTQAKALTWGFGTNIDFTNWYRNTTGSYTNPPTPYGGHKFTSLNPNAGPYDQRYRLARNTAREQELEATGYGQLPSWQIANPKFINRPYDVAYGMQRAVEIEAGRANQDMLMYNHIYDPLPAPPTVDDGTGIGGSGGYPTDYYGSGGGGGGGYNYGGYDNSQRWWLNPTVWRI